MKRTLILVTVLFLLLSGVSVYAGGGQESSETAVVAADPEWIGDNIKYDLNADVAGGKKVSLTRWWGTGPLNDYWAKYTKQYMELHPNVEIEYIPVDGNNPEKLLLASKAGEVNLVQYHSFFEDLWPMMVPYSDQLIGLIKKDFSVQGFRYNADGEIISFDNGAITDGILYNKRIWQEAGLTDKDIPETWDELVELAKKLTVRDDSGKIIQSGFAQNKMIHPLLFTMMAQKGLYWHNAETGLTNFAEPGAIESAQYIYDLYNVYKVCDTTAPLAQEYFGNDVVAMQFQWGWVGGYMDNNFPDVEYDWFPVPVPEKGKIPPAIGRGGPHSFLGVMEDQSAVEKEVSWDFITYMLANDTANIEFTVVQGMIPYKLSVESEAGKYYSKGALDSFFKTIDRKIPGTDGGSASKWIKDARTMLWDMILEEKEL